MHPGLMSCRDTLLVALCAVVATSCTLNWDRDVTDSGAPADGQGDRGRAPDTMRVDTQVDSKVSSPDTSVAPCKGKAPGTVCRKAAGDCDAMETCIGSSDQCPPDKFLPVGTNCRASSGACDPMEKCTGQGPACPADLKRTSNQKTFVTTKGTDGHVSRSSSNKYDLTFGSVRDYCKPDSPSGVVLARGFLSFDTRALPAAAKVTVAKLSGCFLGSPGSKLAYTNLYPATFKLPATSAVYNAPIGNPKTQMPRKGGVNTFAVPVSTIKPGALTQYQLRWPLTTCTSFTGHVWSSSSMTVAMGVCAVANHPWKLVVDYCGP